jgi:hypothetical protein
MSRIHVVTSSRYSSAYPSSADGTMWATESTFSASKDEFARECMLAVDTDRCLCAEVT